MNFENDPPVQGPALSRREILTRAGALATIAGATLGCSIVANAQSEETMGHEGHAMAAAAAAGAATMHNPGLVASAHHCVATGDACLTRGIDILASGDASMAACAKEVVQLSAVCAALAKLAAYDSQHLKGMAAVARDVCVTCEVECRKHAAHFEECLACAEACAACKIECEKIA